jgi:hypothetical protein
VKNVEDGDCSMHFMERLGKTTKCLRGLPISILNLIVKIDASYKKVKGKKSER